MRVKFSFFMLLLLNFIGENGFKYLVELEKYLNFGWEIETSLAGYLKLVFSHED